MIIDIGNKRIGFPSDLRFDGTPSEIIVMDARTMKVKRIDPPFPKLPKKLGKNYINLLNPNSGA